MPAHAMTSDAGLKDAACTTLRELLTIAKRYRKRRQRIDSLFLFDGRTRSRAGKDSLIPRAKVEYDDSPEMELILKRRDACEQLDRTIQVSQDAIEDQEMEPKTRLQILQTLSRLEAQRDGHLEAMAEILCQMGRELMAQENVLAKVVTEGAKLSQMLQIAQDRLKAEAAEREEHISSKSSSDLQKMAKELKQRIDAGEEVFVIEDGGDGEDS